MEDGVVPVLPRGVRLAQDDLRDTPVLLGPERVLMIDAIGEAILSRVDGTTTIAGLCDALCQAFNAPRDVIAPDVKAYLQDLADKRLVDLCHG